MSDLKTLENSIMEKALKKANKEWEQLERNLDTYFKDHPMRGSYTIERKSSDYFTRDTVPRDRKCFLTFDLPADADENVCNCAGINEAMNDIAKVWIKARAEFLAEEHTARVLEKLDLLELRESNYEKKKD